MGRLKEHRELTVMVDKSGNVLVEGHHVGRLEGFRYKPDRSETGAAAKAVIGAAMKALRGNVAMDLGELETDGAEAFGLAPDGTLTWRGEAVARLTKGSDLLKPLLEPIDFDLLEAVDKERIHRRLASWFEDHVKERLGLLIDLSTSDDFKGAAQGLAFQLGQALGSIPRRHVREQIDGLTQTDRKTLREFGLRMGRESIYLPALLKPASVHLRALLWSLWNDKEGLAPPADGRMSVKTDPAMPTAFLEAVGYHTLGPLALRIDILERMASRLWTLSRSGPFEMPVDLLNLVGCSVEDMKGVMKALGYESHTKTVPAEPKAAEDPGEETASAPNAEPEAGVAATEADEAAPEPEADAETGTETGVAATEADEAAPKPEADAETGTETGVAATEADEAAPKPEADAETGTETETKEIVLYRFAPRRARKRPPPSRDRERTKDKGAQDKRREKPPATGKKGKGKGKDEADPRTHTSTPKKPSKQVYDPDSPFAKLKDLLPKA